MSSFTLPSPIPTIIAATEPADAGAADHVITVRIRPEAEVTGAAAPASTTKSAPVCVPVSGHEWQIGVPQHCPTDEDFPADDTIWGRRAAAAIMAVINSLPKTDDVVLNLDLTDPVAVAHAPGLIIGLQVAHQRTDLSRDRQHSTLSAIHVVGEADTITAESLRLPIALGRATCTARDLVNMPSNIKTPSWLAEQIEKLCLPHDRLTVTVRDEAWMTEKGFGGVLAVSAGSDQPARLIDITYEPENPADDRTIVLVGKGVTFDSGGLSLKPASGMETMKTDMGGAAAVVGTIVGCAELGLNQRVRVLVPSAENMPSGSAYRPGDVITHFGGLTTEVGNTDAEGRMLLSDALAYADSEYDEDEIALLADVATLTGAAKVALGLRTGAVMTEDQDLAQNFCRAAEKTGEHLWPLPLPKYLKASVKSTIADLSQAPSGPGALTAALFLQRFAGSRPWVHLDIAGPGRAESSYDEITPLGTGFGARTLLHLLASHTA